MRLALLSGLFLVAVGPAAADPTQVPVDADWRETKRAISDLRSRARERRTTAVHTYDQAIESCNRLVFNSDCLDDAKRDRDRTNREAADIERAALAIEKTLKNETRATKKTTQEQRSEMRAPLDEKRAAQDRNKAEKQSLRTEKEALRESGSVKRDIEAKNRVEKLELRLEKLKPGYATEEERK